MPRAKNILELADIFREYGPEYLYQYGEKMLPSHKKVLEDIAGCRTPVMGGHVYSCDACDETLYASHSCGNRHCPKCGSDRADDWRDRQLQKLLPVNYFLVTCTLPHELNPLAHSKQKLLYRLLFQTSADALHTLVRNPEWFGALIGMVGALHPWDRSMGSHLHVHCKPVGDGRTALKYLTPDVSRVALSNRRLVSMQNGEVTFSDKPRKKPWTTMKLPALSFMQRFLQRVVPKGFQRVRYFGFLHPSAKTLFNAVKEQLEENLTEPTDNPVAKEGSELQETSSNRHTPEKPGICPHCGATLRYIGRLPRCPAIETPEHQQRGPP